MNRRVRAAGMGFPRATGASGRDFGTRGAAERTTTRRRKRGHQSSQGRPEHYLEGVPGNVVHTWPAGTAGRPLQLEDVASTLTAGSQMPFWAVIWPELTACLSVSKSRSFWSA